VPTSTKWRHRQIHQGERYFEKAIEKDPGYAPAYGKARLLLWRQLDPNPAGNVPGHFPLYGENVALVELIALCPEMGARAQL